MTAKPTTTLTIDAGDVALLRAAIRHVSETEAFESDDAHLGKLYSRLERAGYRILKKAD